MEIIDLLKNNRPNLAKSSLKVYKSVLVNLYKYVNNCICEPLDVNWYFNEQEKIMKYLSTIPRDARKLRLSALMVLTEKDCKISDVYKSQMYDDISAYNTEQKLQQKTSKQEKNWISQDEVEKVYKNLEYSIQPLLNRVKLSTVEWFYIQDYVMLSLYVLLPPRRALDYTEFKLHEDPGTEWNGIRCIDDNYYLIFNKYKTAKTYGTQTILIPQKLLSILSMWKIMTNQEWLLIGKTGNKLSVPEMTRRFNNIFGKNISVSMLRHIYISDVVLKNAPRLTELEEIAHNMGHNLVNQTLYNKYSG